MKSVSSGDTITIIQVNENGSSNEFNFGLLGLKAPQLGRRGPKSNNNQPTQDIKDEHWAWQSREFLREKLVGKAVIFRVEYTMDNGKRVGEVWLGTEDIREAVVTNGWANVPPRKDQQGNLRPVSKEEQALLTRLEEAKAKKIGIFREPVEGKSQRRIVYHDFSDQKKEATFFEKHKGAKRKAVVEHVRNGSTLRLYLVDSGDDVEVSLSGIRCPQMKTKDSNAPEKFALDAKFFTEHKLLHRNVTVVLDCVDKFNYYGTVLDEAGNNVVFGLLEFGLAQIVDWTIPSTSDAKAYQAAEKVAKTAKLRIWSNADAGWPVKNQQPQGQAPKQVTGRVIEVNSLSTITVRVQENNNTYESKFHFSSIRAPRPPPREAPKEAPKGKGKGNKEETEEQKKENERKEKEKQQQDLMREKMAALELQRRVAEMTPEDRAAYNKKEEEAKKKLELEKEQAVYAILGKEFLRKKLIGKTVKCCFDYSQTEKDDKFSHNNNKQQQNKQPTVKNYYSIYEGKANVALELVRQGFVNVANHGENQPRSPEFKELITAEREAQKEGRGLFNTKSKPGLPVVKDLSQATDKYVQPFLQLLKQGKHQGVIDMVWSAKKFKIFLPTHSVQIVLSLAGTELPLHLDENHPQAQTGGKGDFLAQHPLANRDGTPNIYNEAYHYARDNFLQRDVEIEVIEMAKVGNSFIGKVAVKNGNKTDDLTNDLLRKGYLRVNNFVSKKLFNDQQTSALLSLEQSAKAEKKGFWSVYNEQREKAILDSRSEKRANERAEMQANTSTDRCIVVTEIVNGSYFFYQVATEKSKREIEDLMKEFGAVNWADKPAYVPVMPAPNAQPPQPLPRVAGNFSVDNTWYRAEVLEIIPGEQPLYKLRYVDYGNTETVPGDRIRALPEEFQKTPFQAKRAKLAYVTAPDLDADYGPEAADFFKSLCWGKDLLANVQFTTMVKEKGSRVETELHHITLGDEETKIFINAAMVMHGLALVDSKKKLPQRGVKWPMWNILKEEEDIAKKDRLNIWQYGEYGSDDDEKKFSGKKGKK